MVRFLGLLFSFKVFGFGTPVDGLRFLAFLNLDRNRNRNRKPQIKPQRNRKVCFAVFALRFYCDCGFSCGFSFFQILTATATANRTPQTAKPQPHIGLWSDLTETRQRVAYVSPPRSNIKDWLVGSGFFVICIVALLLIVALITLSIGNRRHLGHHHCLL